MVRGSRFIPALFGEIQIDSIRQVQHAEKKTHNAICKSPGRDAFGNFSEKAKCGDGAASDHESPTKYSHTPGHKEPCCMKSAAIEDDPTDWQPDGQVERDISQRSVITDKCGDADEQPKGKRRKRSLSNPSSRRRPEGLACL